MKSTVDGLPVARLPVARLSVALLPVAWLPVVCLSVAGYSDLTRFSIRLGRGFSGFVGHQRVVLLPGFRIVNYLLIYDRDVQYVGMCNQKNCAGINLIARVFVNIIMLSRYFSSDFCACILAHL